MSPTTATRSVETTEDTGQQALVPAAPKAILTKYRGWFTRLRKLTTVEEGPANVVAVVVTTAAEQDTAVGLFSEGKALEKEINAYFKPWEKAHTQSGRDKKEVKDAALEKVSPHLEMLNRGTVRYRKVLEAKVAEEVRAAAEKERQQLEREQAKESERLRKEAEKLSGKAKREALSEATAVAEEPIQSVDSAVQDAVEEVRQSFRGGGRAASRVNWKAVVDDFAELVCAVVASEPAMRTRVGELAKRIGRGEADSVNVAALQVYLPELNRRAKSAEKSLRIPGVRAVDDEKIANT